MKDQADGQRFDSLDELVGGSDLAARGTITGLDDRRSLTDPSDPSAGITKRLTRLEVPDLLQGTSVVRS